MTIRDPGDTTGDDHTFGAGILKSTDLNGCHGERQQRVAREIFGNRSGSRWSHHRVTLEENVRNDTFLDDESTTDIEIGTSLVTIDIRMRRQHWPMSYTTKDQSTESRRISSRSRSSDVVYSNTWNTRSGRNETHSLLNLGDTPILPGMEIGSVVGPSTSRQHTSGSVREEVTSYLFRLELIQINTNSCRWSRRADLKNRSLHVGKGKGWSRRSVRRGWTTDPRNSICRGSSSWRRSRTLSPNRVSDDQLSFYMMHAIVRDRTESNVLRGWSRTLKKWWTSWTDSMMMDANRLCTIKWEFFASLLRYLYQYVRITR